MNDYVNVMYSSSAGNAILVRCDGRDILLDCGGSKRKLTSNLRQNALTVADIDYCFVSHRHIDHSNNITLFDHVNKDADYIDKFELSHDVPCSGCRIKRSNGTYIVYITDTGGMPCESIKYLLDASILIIEANHDMEEIKRNTVYDSSLVARILNNHLSNCQTAAVAHLAAWSGLSHVFLTHLSGINNRPRLAEHRVIQDVFLVNGCSASVTADTGRQVNI